MKEKLYLLLVVIASSFLAGCSSDDTLVVKCESVSETPILLQSDNDFFSVKTRASIDDVLSVDSFGIFCLAREKTGINGSSEAREVDWDTKLVNTIDDYGFTTHGVYWNNVKFKPSASDESTTDLVPLPGQDYVRYYPITNWYGYDFFGYYPYQPQSNIVDNYNSDSLAVNFVTDGTIDIIWGRSAQISDPYAYSARYMRKTGETAAHMTFHHSLTQFRFFLVPSVDDLGRVEQFDVIKNLSLKELKLLDTYPNLRMTLANLYNEANVGKVYPATRDITTDFTLKDETGALIEENPVPVPYKLVDEQVMPDTVRLGDCIMACSNEREYFISMCMCDTDNPANEYRSEKRISVKLSNGSPFKPGYIYNIYITVNGVTFVSMSAELEEWMEADDDDSLKFEIY